MQLEGTSGNLLVQPPARAVDLIPGISIIPIMGKKSKGIHDYLLFMYSMFIAAHLSQ